MSSNHKVAFLFEECNIGSFNFFINFGYQMSYISQILQSACRRFVCLRISRNYLYNFIFKLTFWSLCKDLNSNVLVRHLALVGIKYAIGSYIGAGSSSGGFCPQLFTGQNCAGLSRLRSGSYYTFYIAVSFMKILYVILTETIRSLVVCRNLKTAISTFL